MHRIGWGCQCALLLGNGTNKRGLLKFASRQARRVAVDTEWNPDQRRRGHNDTMSDEELYPISVLIEELKSDDVSIRLNSIRRLSTIALALGDTRTRTELLPFLSDSLDDEDEVLLAFAEELSKFVPLVGGAEHAHAILMPLEALAQVEETVVHDEAVKALNIIGGQLSPAHIEQHFVPLIKKLAAEVGWAARVSACGLFAVIFGKVSAGCQKELIAQFKKLVEDDMPMVRRSAAANLGALAAASNQNVVKSDFMELFSRLVADEQDNVRPLAVESILSFGHMLSQEDKLALLVQPLHQASKDRSWRVRYVVAEKHSELEQVLGKEIARTELTPMLVRLLQDQEKEVRTQAALRVPTICKDLDLADRQTIINTNVIRHVTDLCSDQSQHVRVAMASVLLDLGPVLGKEKSIETLVPLFIRLLKDDYFDVRLNIISKLDTLQTVVGKDVVTSKILAEVAALAEDPQWRVRLAICEQMPLLAKSLQADGFDSSKLSLSGVCLNWLQDNVFSVREKASESIALLVKHFGSAWGAERIFPRLTAMGAEKAYLSRLTCVQAVRRLAPNVDTAAATQTLLPICMKLTKDGVPNVRFNSCRALEQLAPKVDKGVLGSEMKPRLVELGSDTDADVKFYSKAALAAC